MTNTHCCSLIGNFLGNAKNVAYNTDVDVIYSHILREYKTGLKRGAPLEDVLWRGQTIFYCPWCGKKLPIRLRGEFKTILRREYNVDPYGEGVIPQEFKSDVWWKTRGL